jgi:hypothetical protein
MKRTVALALALVLGSTTFMACSDSSDDSPGIPKDKNPAAVAAAAGAACAAVDATACAGDTVVTCNGSTWELTLNCASQGKVCGSVAGSTTNFACNPKPVTPGTPGTDTGSACAVNGHTSAVGLGFYDEDLFGYYTVDSYDYTSAGQFKGLLRMFSNPNIAANSTVSLVGGNSNIETCATCIMAVGDDQETTYMADKGTITFTEVGKASGQALKATVTGLELREVTMGETTVNVAQGRRWCIGDMTFEVTLARYPCFFAGSDSGAELGVGGSQCGLGSANPNLVVQCQATSGGSPTGEDLGQLVPGDDCAASGKACSVSGTLASCQ